MVLEGIVTTANDQGLVNIAPMGPVVDSDIGTLLLRPFRSSTTYANLIHSGQGVFHVVDNVDLLARAAIGQFDTLPDMVRCQNTGGHILVDACRWYAFQITSIRDESERAEMDATIVAKGRLRDFFGLCRAKHAVVEAAILATRVGIIDSDQIRDDFSRLAPLVEKTGGESERKAFARLEEFVSK